MADRKQTAAKARPNLYLVGFMGTGKSTVGRALARRLGMQHLDSDRAIEEAQGRPIPDIFAAEGEAYFRKLEYDFVHSGHPESNCVVSCGGGLVTAPGMIEELKRRGLVACLFASPETILSRTKGNANRPLLNVADPAQRIADLLAEREPIYLQAGACFYTDHQPMVEIARHIERYYFRESRRLTAKEKPR
ncbi:shikimate kinase [Cerasicoccus arenae]|uniref:Shikimate kinase n=1 Tax=Cerasicoccus arenae TaxID=424488 RepID=A0A8J3D6U8_9BACT|nr:shikimate kinase [Cerasicoccus arenae]MBK1859765.1 shikimate kinase [Cerasicoccus arenae]GHB90958.1 shikimate kinase [Cerasicoccus arenae]